MGERELSRTRREERNGSPVNLGEALRIGATQLLEEACAHELHADQHAQANAVLARKYGDEYELDVSEGNTGGEEETFIEIDPV